MNLAESELLLGKLNVEGLEAEIDPEAFTRKLGLGRPALGIGLLLLVFQALIAARQRRGRVEGGNREAA